MSNSLEYWRARALEQAETLKRNSETIQQMIKDSYGTDLMKGCPKHGADFTALWETTSQLGLAVDRVNHARGIYATAAVKLEFLTGPQIHALTMARLKEWAETVIGQATRAYKGEPEPAPQSRTPDPDLRPLSEMPRPKVDPRDTVDYWKTIAESQVKSLAKDEEALARNAKKRDEGRALNSRCDVHEQDLSGLRDHEARLRKSLAQNEKAYRILAAWYEALLHTAGKEGVPLNIDKQAKRVNANAHRAWNS